MTISKVTSNGITDSAVTTAKIANCSVATADLAGDAVTSAKITDGTVAAGDLASSLDLSGKTVTLPQSAFSTVDQNIALLGFKMAVNEGLTVFNLVDGVVDEFHDESGTDEGEGSNDTYCASNDNYVNQSADVPHSAGFGYNHRTEPQTSNPATNTYSVGIYTVPTGMTSLNIQAWGAGGGSGPSTAGTPAEAVPGGGGGYAEGTFAVTGSQVLAVAIGQAGLPIHEPNESIAGIGGLGFRGAGNVGGPTPSTGPSSNQGAGGGGASGAVGANATSSSAGNGGSGSQSSITGSAIDYAGGGGAAGDSSSYVGTGGTGGGGAGVFSTSNPGPSSDGTDNLGGGGGARYAAPNNSIRAGNGGTGVVILSVPTANYSSTVTGSPTVTTSGSNTIIKFTGTGTYVT